MVDKDALVRSYAEALFRLAEAEGELDAVERQLFAFAALLERETRVRDALVDPSLPPENKKQLIADAIGEHANPLALNLLGFVIELGRAREVGRIEKRPLCLGRIRQRRRQDGGRNLYWRWRIERLVEVVTKFESLVERRENGSCRNIPWTSGPR